MVLTTMSVERQGRHFIKHNTEKHSATVGVFEKDVENLMDKNTVSSRNEDANMARPQISGTPTIAELRRRVWMRSQPKESTNKAGKKRQGPSN